MYTNLVKLLCVGSCLTSASVALAQDAVSEPVSIPAIAGPLKNNDKPASVNVDQIGDIYYGGVLSGIGFVQSNEVPGDDSEKLDISNGQFYLQKNEGLVQFYVQAGGYSFPTLGTAYLEADDATDELYGLIPVAYLTIAPTDNLSFNVGKLPTLIGAEYAFTFQNANIQRGLLWNQENVINRGIQGNYTSGPLAVSLSLNDGFYSEEYSWVTGLISYAIDDMNSVAFSGGQNMDEDSRSTLETPLLQNNSEIYALSYTHNHGQWSVTPYVQYTNVDEEASVGITGNAESYAAAVLGNYRFTDEWSLAGRAEYIDSDGDVSLLYGPESAAWSLTVTPTFQRGIFFARAEASYVALQDETTGFAFGDDLDEDQQGRLMVETGFLS